MLATGVTIEARCPDSGGLCSPHAPAAAAWGDRGNRPREPLSEHTYRTITTIAGPLLFVEKVQAARIGEVVRVVMPDGRTAEAEVLEIDGETVLVEVYGTTQGLDIERTTVTFTDAVKKVPLSPDIVGRIFNGSFVPKDNAPLFIHERWMPLTGAPINPAARARPADFIETGITAIDGLNTLVRGQKLPTSPAPGSRRRRSWRSFSGTRGSRRKAGDSWWSLPRWG